MAKRIDLRAYQESIAVRLAAAQSGSGAPALLGFETGDRHWLVDLPAAGEVLLPPALSPVPLTRAWFAGLASVHGELQSVVDFSAFCGGPPTERSAGARLLCVGSRLGSNVALLVGRVHGLKRADVLFPVEDEPADSSAALAWEGSAFTDTQGLRWTRLEIDPLFADPAFLDAALPDIDRI